MAFASSVLAVGKGTDISKVEAICGFLEVYIHSILFSRKVYPKTLFEDQFAYGIPVKASRHPGLNQYIINAIAAVKAELAQASLLAQHICSYYQN
ncbi:hypothetical protein BX661DRAFT_175481 [Kickxella alabastrina]|uniref:uncharacterized protein n=1 Tax=Kickxella alabastrina TaxID=61397 RepID=UPI00221F1C45|nr:uncharacterized protein BX661DRAFT_175481 [Kickxella alabastrina]KAI7834760.1 hypothetical protein BX661DRAFT_175481 [Kickxella alabastrina]KAJ1947462.1 MAD2 mitotic arrest deficient-like 2 [Kickxella alabastrina]